MFSTPIPAPSRLVTVRPSGRETFPRLEPRPRPRLHYSLPGLEIATLTSPDGPLQLIFEHRKGPDGDRFLGSVRAQRRPWDTLKWQ